MDSEIEETWANAAFYVLNFSKAVWKYYYLLKYDLSIIHSIKVHSKCWV